MTALEHKFYYTIAIEPIDAKEAFLRISEDIDCKVSKTIIDNVKHLECVFDIETLKEKVKETLERNAIPTQVFLDIGSDYQGFISYDAYKKFD